MAETDNLKQLQERLSKARSGISDSLARQAEMEKRNLYVTWGIVFVIVGFMLAGYATVKSNFASEKVQASLVSQGPAVVASVGEAVSETAAAVIPVYFTEIQNKSVDMLPEASIVLEKELEAFGDDTTKGVEKQLSDALERVEARQRESVRKTFPDLKDEEIEEILNTVQKNVEVELEGLTGYILGKTVGDIVALDKTIKSFDTKNLPNEECELSRLMMHNFLLVLDDELMEVKLETPPADAKKGAK